MAASPPAPRAIVALLLSAVVLCGPVAAADVYGTRFAPPRLYFAHASLNKSGLVSGLRGQDNFLSLYLTPVDNAGGAYTPEGFSFELLLPAYLEVLDAEKEGLAIDLVNIRPFKVPDKLMRISRKRFHVPALAFRINRIKGKG